MSILTTDAICSMRGVTSAKSRSRGKVELQRVGQDIYYLLNQKPRHKGYNARQRNRWISSGLRYSPFRD